MTNDYHDPVRDSGEKSSQSKPRDVDVWFIWSFKLINKFFRSLVSVTRSRIFRKNESKVLLADPKTTLLREPPVNILAKIYSGDDCQSQEVQSFLEKCRDNVSLPSELADFFMDLAHYKAETPVVVESKLLKAAHKLSDLFEIKEQCYVITDQLKAFASKTLNNFTDSSKPEQESENFTFEYKLCLLYVESFLSRTADGNELSADIVEQYWDYLPEEAQKFLLDDARRALEIRDSLLSSENLTSCVSEIAKVYQASASRLENSFYRAIKLGELMPKVRLSDLDDRCFANKDFQSRSCSSEVKDEFSAFQSTGYTLEELLEGMTPENSHEATDWGEPVGNEVW